MFLLIGLAIVFVAMIVGFMMGGGNPLSLIHPSEFVTIGGIAGGSLIAANPISLLKKIFGSFKLMISGPGISKADYLDVMKMLYELFQYAKREGLIALEPHVESPETSSIISKYPSFLKHHHEVEFLCDTLKVILSGGIPAHDLEELMDIDIEGHHGDEHKVVSALQTVGDALPGIGIVAAVLGIIITMGKISEGAETIGKSVASALTGTFLGVLLSYGFVQPMARNLELTYSIKSRYMEAIKHSLLSFAKGAPAAVAVEYARRAIDPASRPSFSETEQAVKSTTQS
jgi:chemotaxis protein MotA